MKHTQVLKRAWNILWQYRALWVFGIILAITTTTSMGNTSNYTTSRDEWRGFSYQMDVHQPILPQLGDAAKEAISQAMEEAHLILSDNYADQMAQTALRAVLWFIGVMIVLGLIGQVFRYMAEVSAIQMVDSYEETGQKRTVGEGFALGWSRPAWRIFLVDLVIELPFALAVLLTIALVVTPIFLWAGDNDVSSWASIFLTIGLAMLLGLLLVAVRAILAVVKPIIRREIALDQTSVGQGIRQGFQLCRKYWKETGLLWLILFGIRIVWSIAIIPLVVISLFISGGLGVGTALLVGGDAFATGDPAMIGAIFAGLAVFIIVLLIPMGFVTGLRETYFSTSWTLTYREINALKALENGEPPVLELEPSAT